MKNSFLSCAVLAMGMAAATSCSNQDNAAVKPQDPTKTVTFEGQYFNALIDTPQYGGPLLYGTDPDEPVVYSWTDQTTGLKSDLTAAWGGYYGYSEGGIAISNYVSSEIQAHADYLHQLEVPVSNGSANFAVVFCPAEVSFADGTAHEVISFDVAPTNYELGSIAYGLNGAASLAESGNLTITVAGFNGNEPTGKVDIDLARDGVLLQDWKTIALSSLGKVTRLSFSMSGSDMGSWGLVSPAYFAFDNVVLK